MKTVANALVVLMILFLLGIVFAIFKYFIFADHATEKKVLAIFVAAIITIPIVGRILHVFNDGRKK
jgi:putative effector of murein hydrolase LrgA (UPF0299 family)